MSSHQFLVEKVSSHWVLKIRAVSSPRPQALLAKVECVYSVGGVVDGLGPEVEFVCSPGNWGNVPIQVGERAVVFLSLIGGKLYESPWQGHLVIELIDGEEYAIFGHRELWLSDAVPAEIRVSSRQDPKRPYATAIRLEVLEGYLRRLIDALSATQVRVAAKGSAGGDDGDR